MSTATVHVSGYSKPIGSQNFYYSAYWGADHPNSHQALAEGCGSTDHAELHAARQAIRIAARQKLNRIVIRCDSLLVYEHIKNSANFAKAPDEIRSLLASIQAFKTQIVVNVERNGNDSPDNNQDVAEIAVID